MNDETAQYDLRCLLDTALRQPFAEYRWSSRRGRRHWYELEPVLDTLAGPLVAIANRGHCGYLYRDPERFPGVVDAPTFRLWVREKLEAVREGVESFRPRTPAEHVDFGFMLDALDELRAAVRLAVELERERGRSEDRE